MKTFSHIVKIYVPSTTDTDRAADTSAYVESAARLLSSLFGGCTATTGRGCWVSESGALVQEDVTIVYAFGTRRAVRKARRACVNFCETMRDELRQEAVSLEINGRLRFI